MNEPKRTISEERQVVYYFGMALAGVGFLLFLSVFLTAAINFGNFTNFAGQAKSSMFRAIGGMFLMIVGGVISHVGAQGLAGSGVILDPQQAREDLEPYSRMTGGMIKDALDETGITIGGASTTPPPTVVKIRCRQCDALNDEEAKFCNQCGAAL